MFRRALLLLMACLAGWGCATQPDPRYTRDGVTYGVTEGVFRGRWWSYYERGASFLQGEFYEEAASDFRTALSSRARDSWSARTYGLHFVEYFPNRELGVALFHIGQYDEAEAYLNTSLEQIDTTRARHYLDLITKARIQAGQLVDEAAPGIEIGLDDDMILASSEVLVEVKVNDDIGVERVEVNESPKYQRGSEPELTFTQEMRLPEGPHRLEVQTSDLAEKVSRDTVEITVDLTGPTVGIIEPPPHLVTDAPSIRLRGMSVDQIGVGSVELGPQLIAEAYRENRLNFTSDMALENGRNDFIVTAKDMAGNETRTRVSVFKGTQDQLALLVSALPNRFLEPLRFANIRFREPRKHYPEVSRRALALAQEAPPVAVPSVTIEVKFPQTGGEYRKNEMRVAGEAIAPANLARANISVRSELGVQEYPLEIAGAPQVAFSKRVPIARGDNTISIDLADELGNAGHEDLRVVGRQVALDTPDSKMSVAVLAFGGAVDENTRNIFRDRTEAELFNQGRFNVLERMRLGDVLQEQQLSAALADPDQALQLGRLIPSNLFLVGSVNEWSDNQIELGVRVIDNETSRIAARFDSMIKDRTNPAEVSYGILGIVEQLREQFPRVPGEVLQTLPDGKTVLANIGSDDGVRDGMYLLVVYEEEPIVDPGTGEILFEGEYIPIGRARITTVQSSASRAVIIETEEGSPSFEQGMPAITM